MPEPTIINNTGGGRGGSAWIVVTVILLVIIAFALFSGGVFDRPVGSDVNVSVDTPNVEAPAKPAAPAAPAAN